MGDILAECSRSGQCFVSFRLAFFNAISTIITAFFVINDIM